MAKYYVYPFGVSGDLTPILDPTQPEGMVSYQQGFTINYQGNLSTDPDARPVPRAQFNQLMYDTTLNLQQYQQYGIPYFISTSDNDGSPFPYALFAMVRYNSGSGDQIYMNILANNTNLPTGGGWIHGAPLGSNTHTTQYTSSGTFVVPVYTTTIFVTAVAGGGGGGGSGGSAIFVGVPTASGGAGGGGCGQGTFRKGIIVMPGETLTITVGGGGTGGTAGGIVSNGGDGTDGGDTVILRGSTPLLTLTGGGNGFHSTYAAASQVVTQGGGGGDATGQPGGSAYVSEDSADLIFESASGCGGAGASSMLGVPASGGVAVRNNAGVPGSNAGGLNYGFGSGGGGASGASVAMPQTSAYAGAAGGNGGGGVVYIDY